MKLINVKHPILIVKLLLILVDIDTNEFIDYALI